MAINSGEYKSTIGLDKLYYAPLTKDDATGYTPGTPVWLAPSATLTIATANNIATQYADDSAFDTSNSEGESTLTITVTNVPLVTAAALLGKTFNASNGMMIDGSSAQSPDLALSFRAMKSNGKYRYIQYLKGSFTMNDEDYETKGASVSPKTVTLVYTALSTIFKFATASGKTETVKRVTVDEDETGAVVTSWFTQVQVPPTVP